VISTTPDTFARLDRVQKIQLEFNERISEQPSSGTMAQAVLVSPRAGEVRVKHGRSSLEVELRGGVVPGQVYRVTVLPVIKDLFNNTMTRPFEFAFSTGGDFVPNAAAGLVLDRITGEAVAGAEVEMWAIEARGSEEPPVKHASRTDSSGIYTFRYVPPGAYRVLAFEDRDRDQEVDPFESQGTGLLSLGPTDTVFIDLVVVPPDTSAAVLVRANVEDSTLVILEFDDWLDPGVPTDALGIELAPVPDSAPGAPVPPPAPPVRRVYHTFSYAEALDSVWKVDSLVVADSIARADSVAEAEAEARANEPPADSLGAPPDSLGAVGDSARAPGRAGRARPGRRARPARAAAPKRLPDGRPLPTRELILVLDGPLPPEVRFRVTVSEVTNIVGLGGGGGEAVFFREAPADTASVEPDSTAVPPDTASVPPDTVSVPPPVLVRPRIPAGPGSAVPRPRESGEEPGPSRPGTDPPLRRDPRV
jgi:hypothetical protein